jgi:hypothetical protein
MNSWHPFPVSLILEHELQSSLLKTLKKLTYWSHQEIHEIHQSQRGLSKFIQCNVTFWTQICVGVAWEDKIVQFPHVMIPEKTNMKEFWCGIVKLDTIR